MIIILCLFLVFGGDENIGGWENMLEQFFALKHAWDPKGVLNPGKGIPTLTRCGELGGMHVRHGELNIHLQLTSSDKAFTVYSCTVSPISDIYIH